MTSYLREIVKQMKLRETKDKKGKSFELWKEFMKYEVEYVADNF